MARAGRNKEGPGDFISEQAKTEDIAYQVRLTALAGGYEEFQPSEIPLAEQLFNDCILKLLACY